MRRSWRWISAPARRSGRYRPTAGFSITAAPLYYDGLVITGFAGGEAGIRGRIKAYDAKTAS